MASRDLDRAIAELAVRQQNVFARRQAIELGATRSAMQRRIDAGHWVVVAPGVYALPAPATFLRRIWIGHLAAGPHSLVSHQTAGTLSEFVGCPKREVILTVPHSGWHRIEGVFVHQISDVLPHHRTTFSGLPITTRARTLVDLATVFRPA